MLLCLEKTDFLRDILEKVFNDFHELIIWKCLKNFLKIYAKLCKDKEGFLKLSIFTL